MLYTLVSGIGPGPSKLNRDTNSTLKCLPGMDSVQDTFKKFFE